MVVVYSVKTKCAEIEGATHLYLEGMELAPCCSDLLVVWK